MSVLGGNPLLIAGDDGYQISRSVRLRSSATAYFNRTPASAGNRQKFTISFWAKIGTIANQTVFLCGANTAASSHGTMLRWNTATGDLQFFEYNSTAFNFQLVTTQVFRDYAAWYHFVFAVDTTQATAANRVIMYVNGTQITSFSTASYPAQNTSLYWNNNTPQYIGCGQYAGAVSSYNDSYFAEFYNIDGQALTPSSFGQTDSVTGVWGPKKYLGTYGTNGFYLPFNDPTITVLSDTATVTAPFGGTATNARVTDGAYVTSNTSTGSSFTFVQYDFGSSKHLSRYYVTNLYFTGGASTFQIQYGDDPTWNTFTIAASLSVTGSAQTFSGSIVGKGRYLRLAPTAFGSNGQANVDALVVYSDNIGADASGNGNSWLPNNISLTNDATYDSMIDVPTMYADGGNGRGNYCIISPVDQTLTAEADGNLKVTTNNGGYGGSAKGSIAVSSGKWYWEWSIISNGGSAGQAPTCGITKTTNSVSSVSSSSTSYAYYGFNGNKMNAGSSSAYGATFTTGDVIGVAFDADGGTLTFYKNGTSQGTAFTGLSGEFCPVVWDPSTGGSIWVNFGQRPFTYTPPTGFKALNTQNLPDATIKAGNKYFDATTYTGNGTSQNVVNSGGFQPDLFWAKKRSAIGSHAMFDSVRGANQGVYPDLTAAEGTWSGQAFLSNGFTVNATYSGETNGNGITIVGWQWKKGATPGFDVVTYTGTGSNQTVNHSLGVAPSFVMVKCRNNNLGATAWIVAHNSGFNWATDYYQFDTGAKRTNGAGTVFTAAPNSSSIFVGSGNGTGQSGGTFVAYLFADVAGFSKFGSYTGNGSADGPFVYLGFRPRYVLIKNTSDGTAHWIVNDSARGIYNQPANALYPNLSNAEDTSHPLDFYSNGFKPRSSAAHSNGSGNTFIYAAFAENPFKNSLAR